MRRTNGRRTIGTVDDHPRPGLMARPLRFGRWLLRALARSSEPAPPVPVALPGPEPPPAEGRRDEPPPPPCAALLRARRRWGMASVHLGGVPDSSQQGPGDDRLPQTRARAERGAVRGLDGAR